MQRTLWVWHPAREDNAEFDEMLSELEAEQPVQRCGERLWPSEQAIVDTLLPRHTKLANEINFRLAFAAGHPMPDSKSEFSMELSITFIGVELLDLFEGLSGV